MNDILTKLASIAPVLGIILILALLIPVYLRLRQEKWTDGGDKFEELYRRLKEEIKFAVAPKFMDLSIGVNDLVDHAIEIWRIEQRISKSSSGLPENHRKALEVSVQKLKRYIAKYDIEIIDYTNQKYNDGFNLDVLSVEKDASVLDPTVKETVEPTIMCKGQVVRKAKIILLTKK